jgi:hypothetical protein
VQVGSLKFGLGLGWKGGKLRRHRHAKTRAIILFEIIVSRNNRIMSFGYHTLKHIRTTQGCYPNATSPS